MQGRVYAIETTPRNLERRGAGYKYKTKDETTRNTLADFAVRAGKLMYIIFTACEWHIPLLLDKTQTMSPGVMGALS